MNNFFKRVFALLKAFVTYCPYCLAGKKVVQIVNGKKNLVKKCTPTQLERTILNGMKTGRNIALIGVFCPFFWFSLLTGASGQAIQFNAIHSGIVILIGLGIMLVYRFKLGRIRKENSSLM